MRVAVRSLTRSFRSVRLGWFQSVRQSDFVIIPSDRPRERISMPASIPERDGPRGRGASDRRDISCLTLQP